MTRTDLAKIVAKETYSTIAQSQEAVKKIVEAISAELKEKKPVYIAGLGVFKIKHCSERRSWDFQSKKTITTPAHDRLAFTPAKEIREAVK